MNRTFLALLLLPAIALAAPVPKVEKGENKLYVTIDGRILRMNPDGTGEEKLFDDSLAGGDMRVSPDGKSVVFLKSTKRNGKYEISVRETGGDPKSLITLDWHPYLSWSADSKTLHGSESDETAKPPPPYMQCWKNWSIDVTTGKRTDMDVPNHFRVWALRPDGKGFSFVGANGVQPTGPGSQYTRTELVTDVRDAVPKILIPADLCLIPMAAFPDGKRWLVQRTHKNEWGVYTAGEKDAELWDVKGRCWLDGAAVSPNGKRVVYAIDVAEKGARKSQNELRTADPNGKNSVTILKTDKHIKHVDWR